MISEELLDKYENLKSYLVQLGSVAIAFSGGVDSTLILKVAKNVLGENVIAVTAYLGSSPKWEMQEADHYCRQIEIRQFVTEIEQMKIEGFAENPANRCYLCKKVIFEKLLSLTRDNKMGHLVEGTNLDDEGDYRPGMKAIEELGVKSPLRELGFTKKDIRELSQYLELPTWNKPSMACLATRFPYGETITQEKFVMVDQAEQLLRNLGFNQVRVRMHGMIARIEVESSDFKKMLDENIRTTICTRLKELGFQYVSLDLQGYRTGSMNEYL